MRLRPQVFQQLSGSLTSQTTLPNRLSFELCKTRRAYAETCAHEVSSFQSIRSTPELYANGGPQRLRFSLVIDQ